MNMRKHLKALKIKAFSCVMRCKDWIISQIIYRTQKLLNTMPKVPYDNAGIAMLENVCLTVLKEAANMGMIAYDTESGSYLYSKYVCDL